MDAEELAASDPGRIADLLDTNPSPRSAWSADEIASIFRHQLAAPVGDGLAETLMPSQGSPALRDVLLKSAGDVLRDPHPPLELLRLIGRSAKARRADRASAIPPEVPTAVYYAAITAAMTRAGTRISDLGDDRLRYGLEWLLGQPWLDDHTRSLFAEGLAALPLPSNGGVPDGRATPP